jgi:O-antigen/teichoic acid export membrane protein
MIVAIIVGLILVPLHINYWESEQYGIWLIINSILSYLIVSNLGMNAAASTLINKTKEPSEKIRILNRSLIIIIISALTLMIIFLIVIKYANNWILIIGDIDHKYIKSSQDACSILIFFYLINVPFSIYSAAINGFYKVYIENIFQIITSVFSVFALLININVSGDLITFSIIFGCSNLLVNLLRISFFYIYIYSAEKIKSNNKINEYKDKYSFLYILKLGLHCFSGGLASLIILNTDNIVISHILGVNYVTPYAVTFKLFMIVFNLIYVLNSSIIPLIGKELGNNNYEKVKYIYERTFYISLWIGGVLWIGSFSLFKDFIYIWSGEQAFAGITVVFLFGGYSFFLSISQLNNIMINSLNYIKGSIRIQIFEAVINIFFSLVLASKYGLIGIALGTLLGVFAPTFCYPPYLKRKSSGLICQNNMFLIFQLLIILFFLIFAFIIQYIKLIFLFKILLTFSLIVSYTFISMKIIPKSLNVYILNHLTELKNKWLVK